MSDDLKHVLEIGNKVFTTFFTTEAVLKLMALSKEYFSSGWNIFDLVIVIASLVDLFAESIDGISVLRGMRLVSRTLSVRSRRALKYPPLNQLLPKFQCANKYRRSLKPTLAKNNSAK